MEEGGWGGRTGVGLGWGVRHGGRPAAGGGGGGPALA